MKTFYFLTIALLFFSALLAVMIGCKMEVAQPLWDEPAVSRAPTPTITGIVPADSATPGVNTITIQGQNFSDSLSGNIIYINNVIAEIISSSNSSITICRPNLVSSSAIIELVSYGALHVAKSNPYAITSVMDNLVVSYVDINAIEVDKNENLFFVKQDSGDVFKLTPGGAQTKVGNTGRLVSDIKFAPNGKLYLISSSGADLQQMDLTTGNPLTMPTHWVTPIPGQSQSRLNCGDFDANGNFYVGGTLRSLYVIGSDTSKKTVSGYSSENVVAIRVYNNYVYILSIAGTTVSLWRHQILDASGSLSAPRELVVNFTSVGLSNARMFTFSSDGIIYIETDGKDPIVMYNITNGNQEILYKGILPSVAKKLIWGTGSRLFMTYTGTAKGIMRISAGVDGAPYFGRR